MSKLMSFFLQTDIYKHRNILEMTDLEHIILQTHFHFNSALQISSQILYKVFHIKISLVPITFLRQPVYFQTNLKCSPIIPQIFCVETK